MKMLVNIEFSAGFCTPRLALVGFNPAIDELF
jgi:hypothetical protein